MAPAQVGPQVEVHVPEVGEYSRLAVVVGKNGVAQHDAPHVDFFGQAGCIVAGGVGRRGVGRRGQYVPVGLSIACLVGIYVGAVQHEAVNVYLLVPQVVHGIDDEHHLLEGKERVGALPQGVAQGFGDERAVRQLQPEAGEGGEEGQFHASHVQLGVELAVGHVDYERGDFLGREDEVDGYAYGGGCRGKEAGQRDGGHLDGAFQGFVHDCFCLCRFRRVCRVPGGEAVWSRCRVEAGRDASLHLSLWVMFLGGCVVCRPIAIPFPRCFLP